MKMKRTVFTVIAVLLLLATVQFAAGYPVDWGGGVSAVFTVHNDYDKALIISIASMELSSEDIIDWTTWGWWRINPGESREFTHGKGPLYVRMMRFTPGAVDGPYREVIPEFGRAFYARDSRKTGFRDGFKYSASFFTAVQYLAAFDEVWPCAHLVYQHSPYKEALHSNPAEPLELTEGETHFQLDSHDNLRSEWFSPNSHWVRSGEIKTYWSGSRPLPDDMRIERATYWRYPISSEIRVGGSTPTTIDGLSLGDGWQVRAGPTPLPEVGGNAFIIFKQYGNTCGPTSLEMVLHYYKKRATMDDIWRAGDIDTVEYGTWPGEMQLALNELGVPADRYDEDTGGYRNDPFERLRRYVDGNRPPCILIRYSDRNDEARYHWVVVVGYHYDSDAGIDKYLTADPNGFFRWVSRSRLDLAWSFKGGDYRDGGYWNGGFDATSKADWSHLAVDLATDPYTAIVPQSGATSHYPGYWTEMRFKKIEGDKKRWGKMRDWEETFSFDYSFDFFTVSEIDLSHWGAEAFREGSRIVDDDKVKLWGRIEDGKWKRGELDVMVRTFRRDFQGKRTPYPGGGYLEVEIIRPGGGAPSQVVSTRLLPNYPNPFNPETWIPYQLSEPAEVAVSIYSVDGTVVRRLDLGQMPSGVYRSRSRAAYWDGRNASGEPVASGVYFYTLTAGDFKATRKLVIRK